MDVSKDTMTRYLLGELPEEEQTAFEKAYFDDPQVFAALADAESALIDDYVRGRLPSDVRGRFERVYLADPRRRERVQFAEGLVARADAAGTPDVRARAWFSPLALAAAIVIAIGAALIWYAAQSSRPQQDSTTAGSGTPAQPPAPTASEPPDRRTTPSGPVAPIETVPTLALVLAPGVRSAGGPAPTTLVVPAGAPEVRLALTIRDPESQRLRVILRAVGGNEIARRDLTVRAGASATALTLNLPANSVASGDYMVTLQGAARDGEFEDLSQSLFQVRREQPR